MSRASAWADAVADAVSFLPDGLVVAILAALPIMEVRGSIPFGVAILDMPVLAATAWSLLGNLAVLPALWWLLPRVEALLRRAPLLDRWLTWLWARVHDRHSARIDHLEEAALLLMVALPVPGTGLWTGAVAAYVFGLPAAKSLPFVIVGAIMAAVAVAALTAGAFAVF